MRNFTSLRKLNNFIQTFKTFKKVITICVFVGALIKLEAQNCNCDLTIGSGSPSGISNWSQAPWQTGTIVNKKICVYGNLNMNVSRKFLSCWFYMQPNASITVTNNAFFQSNLSKYYACENAMWNGILVSSGKIYFNSNKVYDAKIGVDIASGQGMDRFLSNTFDRCNIGLKLVSVTPRYEMVGNNYLCNGTLKAPFSNMLPEVGIYMSNSFVRERKGVYNNLNLGIMSDNFGSPNDLKIDGNIMTNFVTRAIIHKDFNISVKNTLIRNCGQEAILCNFSGTYCDLENNQIYNALVGIKIGLGDYCDIYTSNNIMDSIRNNGIFQGNCESPTRSNHVDNKITTTNNIGGIPYDVYGIQIQNTNPTSAGIIEGNEIYIPLQSSKGIAAGIFFDKLVENFKIQNNPIINIVPNNATSDERSGIRLVGGISKNIEISNNHIIGDRNKNLSTGILQGNNYTNISYCCNTLTNLNIGMEIQGTANNTFVRGETFTGPYTTNALFFNNCITGVTQTLPGNDWTGIAPVDARFVGATREAQDNPFLISSMSLPFFPDNPIDGPNGWFKGNSPGTETTCEQNPTCISIVQYQGNCDDYPNDSLLLYYGYDGMYGDGQTWQARKNLMKELIRDANYGMNCPEVVVFKNQYINLNIGKLAQVAILVEDIFKPNISMTSQINTYHTNITNAREQIRIADEHLLNPAGDSLYWEDLIIANIDIMQMNMTSLHNLIQTFKANQILTIPSILTLLNSISPSNIREINDVYVYNFELQCLLNSNDCVPNTTQTVALYQIANQCPLVGGDAVLRAQYILSENDPNINNFNNNCSSNQALISAISNETLNEIKLYPNPSNGEIQIKIPDGKLDELYTFEISDITGKLLFKADKYSSKR